MFYLNYKQVYFYAIFPRTLLSKSKICKKKLLSTTYLITWNWLKYYLYFQSTYIYIYINLILVKYEVTES